MPSGGTAEWRIMKRMKNQQITALLLALALALAGCAGSGTAAQSAAGSTTGAAAAAVENSDSVADVQEEDSGSQNTGSAPRKTDPAGREGLLDFSDDEDTVSDDSAAGSSEGGTAAAAEEDDDSRAMAAANQVQKAENAKITLTGENLPVPAKDYTIMIYMVGSNLETNRGAATDDLEEMLSSGIDFQKNNVVVYTGGARKWFGNIPCDRNCVLDLSRGEDNWIVGTTDGNSDMGSTETLAEFLQIAAANYPAQHYGLIFWDHGNGPINGFGVDELFGNDSLQFGEIRAAMDPSPFANGGNAHLDWVGFDACLMGSIENAKLWSRYTDYMIASEELEPAGGWDYSFLQTLNETTEPVPIASSVTEKYYNWYVSKTNNAVTLAVYDLKKTDNVVKAYTDLTGKMNSDIQAGQFARVVKARNGALRLGTSENTSRGSGTDLLDLSNMAGRFTDYYKEESDAVRTAVTEMVIDNKTNIKGATGISVYFPGENRTLYQDADSFFAETVSVSEDVHSMYDAYADRWGQASDTNWTMAEFRESGDEILLDLTKEQVDNLAGATYTILRPFGQGEFSPAMVRVRLDADADGVLHIPADPELICMDDSDGSKDPICFIQTNDNQGTSTYRSYSVFLSPAQDFWDIDVEVDQAAAIIADVTDGEVMIQSVQADDEEAAGKNTLSMEDYYRILYFFGSSFFPVRNEDGTMKSFADWKGQGAAMGGYTWDLPEDRSIHLDLCHASEIYTEEPMILQVELTDVNGQTHASEIYTLKAKGEKPEDKTYTFEDEQGTWTFRMEEDAAVLTNYSGDADKLTVPAEANGLPVTEIEESAIVAYSATEIILPDSLKILHKNAVGWADISSISLPSGIEKADSYTFGECEKLEQILIDGNPNGQGKGIRTIDGVLFNADGTVLLNYPVNHGQFYAVPEGTETIAYAAFAANTIIFGGEKQVKLESVSMPASLKRIEPCAFFGCYHLSEINLPDSLEYIGSRAFGTDDTLGDDPFYTGEYAPIEEIYIGKNVEKIGRNAFDGLNLRRFRVSPANRRYAETAGMLTGRSGDTILEVPRGMDGMVYIPEGVVGLDDRLFSEFYNQSEFYLPDSLTRIPANVFPCSYSDEKNEDGKRDKIYDILLHCSEDSAAAAYADKYGISRDTKKADEALIQSLQYTTITLPSRYGQNEFHVYKDHAVLVACKGTDMIVEIPASAGGQPVTEIGDGRNSIFRSHAYAYNRLEPGQNPASEGLTELRAEDTMQNYEGAVKELQMPETVTAINANALAGTSFEPAVLELPSSLIYFDPQATGGDMSGAEIGAFHIEGSKYYKTIDGVLYTADGKTLTAFPNRYDYKNKLEADGTAANGDTVYIYNIPEGTERIGAYAFHDFYMYEATLQVGFPDSLKEVGEGAFYSVDLNELVLPEGTEKIDNKAFYLADIRSEELLLPDSITEIGTDAFMHIGRKNADGKEVIGFTSVHLPADLKTLGEYAFNQLLSDNDISLECQNISLGSKISHIGNFAFADLDFRAFEVNKRNKTYSAKDGFLLSKDGKSLILAPSGMTGEVTVPDTVTRIEPYALYDSHKITDIHISGKVTEIGSRLVDETDGEFQVTIHCPAGSPAARYAELVGIPWVEEP